MRTVSSARAAAGIQTCAAADVKTHKQQGCLQIFDKADIKLSNRSYNDADVETTDGNESSLTVNW
jgi:hypothetical protein